MVGIGQFVAEVLVDGVPLHEYNDDVEEDEHTDTNGVLCITKYVEAVSNTKFCLRVSLTKTYSWKTENAIGATMAIDGRVVGGRFLERPHLHHDEIITSTKKGILHCGQELPFIFGDIIIDDQDHTNILSESKKRYDNLGSIVIAFLRVMKKDMILGHERALTIGGEPVPEKALKGKAIGLTTIYGSPEATNQRIANHVCLDKHPLAKITFKYRTRAALQSLMIIERTPTPPPLDERPIEDLSAEELREVVRLQRAQIQANIKTKKEEPRIKRERSRSLIETGPALKKSKGTQGQTIYQVDSDDDDIVEEVPPLENPEVRAETEVVSLLQEA